jgi:rhodanese-related sulfurtransferase
MAFAAIAALSFAACQKVVEYSKFKTEADVPRIALADAKKDFDTEAAVFVDSRPEPSYKSEHISGSVNVPFGFQDAGMDKLPKGKKIIVYCS